MAQEIFSPGDEVIWTGVSAPSSKTEFGPGPFTIESTEEVPDTYEEDIPLEGGGMSTRKAAGHPQYLYIRMNDGELYKLSGAWFKRH